MQEVLQSIDWLEVLSVIWTVILIPVINYIKNQFTEYMKARNLEQYSNLLLDTVDKVVKELQNTVVDSIKGTNEWTDEKQQEILEIAKKKVIIILTTEGYNILDTAIEDINIYIETLIESKVYDLKHGN